MQLNALRFIRRYALAILSLSLVLVCGAVHADDLGAGSDLEIGGPGSKPGEFLGLEDITFDAQNRLYVLDGYYFDGKLNREVMGNDCVHVFDNNGHYLTQFSLALAAKNAGHRPTRIAVDSHYNVFVTEPEFGVVVQYAPPAGYSTEKPGGAWERVHVYPVPKAFAVAVGKIGGAERVLVAQHFRENDKPVLFGTFWVIDPRGMTILAPIKLDEPLGEVDALAIDPKGAIYAVASLNQLYKYDSNGKRLFTLGAGTRKEAEDASELQHTVALDSQGNFYTLTPGNPGSVARFDPTCDTVAMVPGEFKWADAWGPFSRYTILAIDGHDRLWAATTRIQQKGPVYHYSPCVLRVSKDFLAKAKPVSTRNLGLDAKIEVKGLPFNLAYDLSPIHAEWVLGPASRRVKNVTLDTFVYDVYKTEIAHTSVPLELKDGQESRQPIDFTPPAFGWYTIECQLREKNAYLSGVGEHVGVTPPFPDMPALAKADSQGGWCDPAKFAFCGLKLIRANTNDGLGSVEKYLAGAMKYNLNLLVQFENRDHCSNDIVLEFVTHFKGRVKYWEIINEPNTAMSPDDYAAIAKRVVPIIKEIDPAAQVMGPDTVGIDLGWNEAVFKSGAAALFDIISIHDYEGDEAISPNHWRWKIGKLRDLMATYKLAGKPIWQTERAISAIRGSEFTGGIQAVRMMLHRDLLETLDIPSEHNHHYYMNQAGYSQVPSYIFSENGPHPAFLALRTRCAMVSGRAYKDMLDFGLSGNNMFMGLRFAGKDGKTIILHQTGATEAPALRLDVSGDALEVVDSFGNVKQYPVVAGTVSLTVPPLPLYLRLKPWQTAIPRKLDFGENFAVGATFSYSSSYEGSFDSLTNGILEVTHGGNPWGPYWKGKLGGAPQTLEMEFPIARNVNRMIVYSMEADNPHCTLLDFDVQAYDGAKWVTIKQVRTPLPASQFIKTADSRANTWYMGQNWTSVTFPAIRTTKLRIVALRTTYGFQPDELATAATGWKANDQTLCLREVEVYGETPIMLSASAPVIRISERAPIEVDVDAIVVQSDPFSGSLRPVLPQGWTAKPDAIPLKPSDGGKPIHGVFQLLPPEQTRAGAVQVRIDAVGVDGQPVDCAFAQFTLSPAVKIDPHPVGRDQQGRLYLRVKTYPLIKEDLKGTLKMKIAIGEKIFEDEKPIDLPAGNPENEFAFVPDSPDFAGKTITVVYTAHEDDRFDSSEIRLLSQVPLRYLGPFDNEGGHKAFDIAYPPETEIDLAKTYQTVDGPATWKKGETKDEGFFDFIDKFKTHDHVVAYAVTFIYSPIAQPALLNCGSDDGIKAWMNKEPVISHDVQRGVGADQEMARVKLRKGWNTVLLKITQVDAGWGLYLRVTDEKHQPIFGVRYADAPG